MNATHGTIEEANACRAHVLEKIIGFERHRGTDTAHLESLCDRLYGTTDRHDRDAKERRRTYARAKRAEEMRPFLDAISDAYPQVTVRMDWSRKHGLKTIITLKAMSSFGPQYVSTERYGGGDPDDILPRLPEIVESLQSQASAQKEVEQLIASGTVIREGGFVRIPGSDARLPLAWNCITHTLAAIRGSRQ